MTLFILLSKTNKINNIYFQFLREKKKNYQLKSISSLNPKQQTDLVNNFPEQMSSLAILPLLRLNKGGPRHGSSKVFLLINWTHGKYIFLITFHKYMKPNVIDKVFVFTISTYSLVGSILSTIEWWMCPVIHVILTSGWEKNQTKNKHRR